MLLGATGLDAVPVVMFRQEDVSYPNAPVPMTTSIAKELTPPPVHFQPLTN